MIEVVCLANGLHFLVSQFARRIEHVAKTGFHQPHIRLLLFIKRCQGNFGLPKRMLINNQPMVRRAFIDERYLHISRLLTGIHFTTGNNMVEVKFAFHVGRYDAQLIHAFLWYTLHIAFITHPCSTPTCEVDTKGKGSTEFAIFQKFETYLLVLCLLVVHPHDKGRKIEIFTRRILLLEHQIFFYTEYSPRLILPAKTMKPIFVVFIVNSQSGSCIRRHIGRYLTIFEREQTFVFHYLCFSLRDQEEPQKHSCSTGPFVEMHHILLVYLRLLQCLSYSVTKKRHFQQTNR